MTRIRLALGILAVGVAVAAAWPALAALGIEDARLLRAPDGVLFVVHEGIRYRVIPRPATEAELGAIPEGAPLPVGLLAPAPESGAATPAGPTGPEPRVIQPTAELGLAREAPVPLGATCSCTIDRAGRVSQFDVTVVRVLRDAYPFLQQGNRFNRPPAEGNTYVGVLIDQKYIAGPEDQAYTILPTDFRAASTTERLRDPAAVINPGPRMEGDVYPGATLAGWVFFELPANEPAVMVWQSSFLGERGVWFALQ